MQFATGPEKTGLTLQAFSSPHRRTIDFYLEKDDERDSRGVTLIADSFRFREQGLYEPCGTPSFSIDMGIAQSLIDDLYRAGLRPSDVVPEGPALDATRKHLEDMRTIAFDRLKIKQ